jgi:phosphate-selective porin OprO and OprP
MTNPKFIAAKRIAVAVATVCASLSAPAFAGADDVKAMMDLLLKKGVITQAEYNEHIKAAEEAAENRNFKEKRIDQDVAKANAYIQKNADAGQVMKNGLGLQSADGRNSIQLMGRVHMDYRGYSDGGIAAASDPFTDQLDIRRARLGARGQIDKDWKFEIQGTYGMGSNGMSESTTIVDIAFLDYAANPAAMFRFGKFKMPFSLEQLTSSNNIDFMERSFANQNEGEYVPAKETGVMLHGSPMDGTSYGLAFSRGRGNKSSQYDGSDFIGRGTVNVAKLMGRDDIVTHLGLGYSSGTVTSGTSYASARDESRGVNGFFNGTETVSAGSSRTRSDIEYAIAYGPYKVQGEFFGIKYDETSGGSKQVKLNYNEILWNITGESHSYSNSNGTFGWVKPAKKFSLSGGGLGAWQVGVRLSELDGSDFTAATGRTDKATGITYGLNWIVNDNVRFMLNYVETKFDTPVNVSTSGAAGSSGASIDKVKAIMLRSQIWF